MLPKKILEAHYKEYAAQSDAWVNNMEITKKSIVKYVLKAVQFKPATEPVRIAVLGASDKRYAPIHQRIFRDLLKKSILMVTFDIDIDHFGGKEGVVEHDATKPFPKPPYDIVFSHELMKFLTQKEQLCAIRNSYCALADDGLAMHILHPPSIKGTAELRSWQYRVNPDLLLEQLNKEGIPATKLLFNNESDVDWLRETTVLVIQKHAG